MRRFSYGLKSTHLRKYDPEDPDARPISLVAQIVKPRPNQPVNVLNFKLNAQTKNSPNLKSGGCVFMNHNITCYTPPQTPDLRVTRSQQITNFLNSFARNEMSSENERMNIVAFDDRQVSKEENVLIAKNFVKNFIMEKTKDVHALVIQNAFRLYRTKRHWHKCIGTHVQYHLRLKKLMFLCWELSHTICPTRLEFLYQKFLDFYPVLKNRFKIREMAPFRLFYISGRLFLPEGYSATVVYSFIYMMSMPLLHRILRLWAYTSRKRKDHRKTMIFIRYTSKKLTVYGQIYHFFDVWHRYILWKKLANNANGNEKYIKFSCPEVNVRWNILERQLNTKRIHKLRADEHSRKRISSKAVRALYNRSIETIAKSQVLATSDSFRNIHLQMLAHRAWLKYLQKRSQESQVLRDAFHSWYGFVYDRAERDFKFEMSTQQHDRMKLIKIMNSWFRITQEKKMVITGKMLQIQSSPGIPLAIIFLLKNEFELFFSVIVFKTWVRFVRSRNRWKNFARWSSNELDKDRETSHSVLTELRRAANLKLIGRLFVSACTLFPRHVGFSFELTQREYYDIKQTDEKQSKNHLWNFMTNCVKSREAPPKFTCDVLVRCFLLRLNQFKKYDNQDGENGIKRTEGNPYFERIRTQDELLSAFSSNRKILHKRIPIKIARDKMILSGLVSHISAKNTAKAIIGFTIQSSFTFVSTIQEIKKGAERTAFFPDIKESLEEIKKSISDSPPKIPYNFESIRNEAIEVFHRRLRDPQVLQNSKSGKFISTITKLCNAVTGIGQTMAGPARNSMINSYSNNGKSISKNDETSAFTSSHASGSITGAHSVATVECDIEEKSEFTLENFKSILEQFGTSDQMVSKIVRFIMDTTGIYLDTTKSYSILRHNEVTPNADQTNRHIMTKNIALFLAQISGYKDLDKIPRRVDNAPPYAIEAVNAILTVHAAMMKTALAQYCDVCPFSRQIKVGDPLVSHSFGRIWNNCKKKYPKIECPIGAIPLARPFALGHTSRRGSITMSISSFTSSNSSLSLTMMDEGMTSKDIYLACFLIPYIISFDSIADFSKDEILLKIQK